MAAPEVVLRILLTANQALEIPLERSEEKVFHNNALMGPCIEYHINPFKFADRVRPFAI